MSTTSENMVLAGLGFLVIAAIFFVLFGFVYSIRPPQIDRLYERFGENNEQPDLNIGNIQQETRVPLTEYSFLWVALFVLSLIVVVIGVKIVHTSYTGK